MKRKDPDSLKVVPGTIEDWWSARYTTAELSEPVTKAVAQIRQLLSVPETTSLLGAEVDMPIRQSALRYIEDAQAAIDAYRVDVEQQTDYWPDNQDDGRVLLSTFGLLQAFVLQQDAVRLLWRSLDAPRRNWWSDFPDLQYIRRVRNAAAGHPCDLNAGSTRKSHYVIHRNRLSLRNLDMSGQHEGTIASSYGAQKQDCLIVEQSLAITLLLSDALGFLTGGPHESAVGWTRSLRPWKDLPV